MAHRRVSEDEESIVSEENEPAECHTFDILEVLLLFVIHLFDFVTDFLLAINYFRSGKPLIGLTILGIVYVTSFFSTVFERKSKSVSDPPQNKFLFFLCGFAMFIFNCSGIVMFLQTLYKLCKCTSSTNHELRSMQLNLVYLKTIEGFVESVPQIYVQFVLLQTKEMKSSSPALQFLSILASYLGFVYTIIHYAYHVTPDITGVFNKIFRALWIFFMSVSWATIVICIMIFFITNTYSTPIILYIHILFTGCVCVSFNLYSKPVVMIVLSFFCLSQYFFPDEYRDSDAEKDKFVIVSHILHFLEMGVISIIWYFAYDHTTIFYKAIYIIIGCYILGEFFFIIFQIRLKNSKSLEVRHINYFQRSRRERVSLISLRALNRQNENV